MYAVNQCQSITMTLYNFLARSKFLRVVKIRSRKDLVPHGIYRIPQAPADPDVKCTYICFDFLSRRY